MKLRPLRPTTTARWLLLGLLAGAGCDNTLETGYVPRPLNATEADRKSFYAPAFSPDSHPDKDNEGTGFNFAH
jgi:hypothetical protein